MKSTLTVPDSNFEIEYHHENDRLRMTARAGYGFQTHAIAALALKQLMSKTVLWEHNDGDVSTDWGATPAELLQRYEQEYPQA